MRLTDRVIVLTGCTGQVGEPLARALAERNEVHGIARFGDPEVRASMESAGIVCHPVNLVDPGVARRVPGELLHESVRQLVTAGQQGARVGERRRDGPPFRPVGTEDVSMLLEFNRCIFKYHMAAQLIAKIAQLAPHSVRHGFKTGKDPAASVIQKQFGF